MLRRDYELHKKSRDESIDDQNSSRSAPGSTPASGSRRWWRPARISCASTLRRLLRLAETATASGIWPARARISSRSGSAEVRSAFPADRKASATAVEVSHQSFLRNGAEVRLRDRLTDGN
ncbi:hypothetical protein GCM10009539_04870 [Cryptosporangium japonicum]|uniref:Uncharacterized protein n=1 Tax=Cryptosporangium japonicum TaxID=80872 RepID=A0ABN0TIS0_9ACTN